MSGYAHADRAQALQQSADGSDPAAVAETMGVSLNHSPRVQSLLQMRQSLDRSPRVQSQRVLQRVLNPGRATGAADRSASDVAGSRDDRIVQRTISYIPLSNRVEFFNDAAETQRFLAEYTPRRYGRIVSEWQLLHPTAGSEVLTQQIVAALQVMIDEHDDYRLDSGDWSAFKRFLDQLRALLGLGEENMQLDPVGFPATDVRGESAPEMFDPPSVEPDTVPFWNAFNEKHGANLVPLRNLIVELSQKWRAGESSDWDGTIFREALERFSERAGYQYFPPLGVEQSEPIKSLLLGQDTATAVDPPIPAQDISSDAAREIVIALDGYATAGVQQIPKRDKPEIDLSGERTAILVRAVSDILESYGVKMLYATAFHGHDTRALDNLRNARLHHATARWGNASPEAKESAAEKALHWTMSSIPQVEHVLTQVQQRSHGESSIGRVREAYAQAIWNEREKPGVKAILAKLAQLRLSWGPITYGPDIYIEADKTKISLEDQWELYQTLIHEALHSAEHPAFADFLANALPESIESDVREGIVEYLARVIWARVMSNVVEKTGAGTPPSAQGQLATTKARIARIKESTHYGPQVEMMQRIVALLDSGEKRLEAAYFYGNVKALLPRMVEPVATSEEDMSDEDDEGSDDDSM
ncbi:hypothetical protein [Bradyrhizobium prioriisuperbiae]|uniref:hypothetical protein n=1 Tax=Bradyrhizobium prioriisuperbiae TaxID=2854389 RepID=UPI0028E89E4C|nr:hypothetical protein [Bradyrhizobium prioritasuperba]